MKLIKLLALLSVFSSFACSPKYYSPNTQQITLFEEEGDINLSLIADASKIEGHAAYAITDQYAFAANFSRFVEVEVNSGKGSGYIFEIAPGYYKGIGEHMIFEIYGQLGFGKFQNSFSNLLDTIPSVGVIESNAMKIGLQPSLAYTKDRFSVALSSRISSLNYFNIKGDLIYQGFDQIQLLQDNKSNLLIEPALTAWFGFDKFKLQAQYALSFMPSTDAIPRDKQLFSIGINAKINTFEFR